MAEGSQGTASQSSIWAFGGVIALLIVAAAVLIFAGAPGKDVVLPLLVLAGVLALLLTLGMIAALFSGLGITDQKQALGLPDGSVRAVIAISLIVIFAVAAIYLYNSVSYGGRTETKADLSEQEARAFTDALTKISGGQYSVYPALPIPPTPPPKEGEKSASQPQARYMVMYRLANNGAGEDLAKQLIVLLGTLITAVSSFYFGSASVASATAAVTNAWKDNGGQRDSNVPRTVPTVTGITPPTVASGTTTPVKVSGQDLAAATAIELRRAHLKPIRAAAASKPSATEMTYSVQVAADPLLKGDWEIWLLEGTTAHHTNQHLTIT